MNALGVVRRAQRCGLAVLLAVAMLAACATPPPSSDPTPPSSDSTPPSPSPRPSAGPTTSAAPVPTPSSAPTPTEPPVERTGPDDPRWQFFVKGKTRYRSDWFDGSQRIMIGYGCTPAPFYAPDSRCDGDGFHHGIDVALPCRTTLRAGVNGSVIDPDRPGRPGPAYGSTAFRMRVEFRGETYDVLIGHATRVFVQPGDRVRAGERIATAGARASPDGCHLHFEQRRVDGGVATAVNPARLLGLRPA